MFASINIALNLTTFWLGSTKSGLNSTVLALVFAKNGPASTCSMNSGFDSAELETGSKLGPNSTSFRFGPTKIRLGLAESGPASTKCGLSWATPPKPSELAPTSLTPNWPWPSRRSPGRDLDLPGRLRPGATCQCDRLPFKSLPGVHNSLRSWPLREWSCTRVGRIGCVRLWEPLCTWPEISHFARLSCQASTQPGKRRGRTPQQANPRGQLRRGSVKQAGAIGACPLREDAAGKGAATTEATGKNGKTNVPYKPRPTRARLLC